MNYELLQQLADATILDNWNKVRDLSLRARINETCESPTFKEKLASLLEKEEKISARTLTFG